ncbi:MAG: ADP-ribosylation factor-like protein [Promethearchaeia archaeon]
MSESAKKIIKYFCDSFLDIDYYPTTLKSVLNLPVDSLKNINSEDLAKLNNIQIKIIKDLTNLDINKIEKIAKKIQINKDKLQHAIIAAHLISNAWNKRKIYLKKPQMKVVIAGLDYAGKTSLINRLISNQNYSEILNLEPTIGANIEQFQSERLNLVIWDLGGQKNHIEEYLSEPERFFIQVDVLIFVIDSQDDRRYDEAVGYLGDILKILEFLTENPYILILLNKADADLIEDPDFQIKLEYLSDKIINLFKAREKKWNYEIINTSIFNYYSQQPEIAKSIKNIFSREQKGKDREEFYKNLEEKLQILLDISLNLLDRVSSDLAEIKRVLGMIVPTNLAKSLYSIPFENIPLDYVAENEKDLEKEKKEQKKKSKKISKKIKQGPPKRLTELPKPKDFARKEEKIEELMSLNSLPSLNLKPPPPPPKEPPSPPEGSPPISRAQIISELKEVFQKRGIIGKY